MEKQKNNLLFEEKLEALENLTCVMEEGKLGLEELLRLYEQGIQLANSLKSDLDLAQTRLMELKGGALKPAEEP
jgi:exodeoxyribonuclease VII small subunit